MKYNNNDYGACADVEPQIKEDREIPKYLSKLEKQIFECIENFLSLQERLNPVSCYSPEIGNEDLNKVLCNTEIGGRLCGFLERLGELNDKINTTRRNLEI